MKVRVYTYVMMIFKYIQLISETSVKLDQIAVACYIKDLPYKLSSETS